MDGLPRTHAADVVATAIAAIAARVMDLNTHAFTFASPYEFDISAFYFCLWSSCGAGCAGGYAAIYKQRLARDVAAGFGCEKDNSAIQIMRLAMAFERYAVHEVLDPLAVFIQNLVLLSLEPSGSEAIYGDAVFAPVIREAHGQLLDAAATRAIWA